MLPEQRLGKSVKIWNRRNEGQEAVMEWKLMNLGVKQMGRTLLMVTGTFPGLITEEKI